MAEQAHWQVQEAKQRFSEVLRAVEQEGPQIITRHGDEVAAIIDIEDYRRLATREPGLKAVLLGPPYFDGNMIDIMDEIEAERKTSFAPVRDFEIELGLVDDHHEGGRR